MRRKLVWNLGLAALAVAALVAVQVLTGTVTPPVVASPPPGGGSTCEGDAKIDGNLSGQQKCFDRCVTGLCVKAGTGVFTFTSNGSNGCYNVSGLGTNCVTVSGGGTGPTCKAISHVAYFFGDTCTPTPTPTPTPEPSPTP